MPDVLWPAAAVLMTGMWALAVIALLCSDLDVEKAYQKIAGLQADKRAMSIELAEARNDARKAQLELEFVRAARGTHPVSDEAMRYLLTGPDGEATP